MTDNRTTELLRKLLDERGLSCQTHYLHVSWRVGSKLYDAVDNLDGTLTVDNLTPEQAVAATLGSEFNHDGLPVGLTISDDSNLLNWRGENYVRQSALSGGKLTVEQVRECVQHVYYEGYNDGSVYRGHGIEEVDWQTIADELNSRAERTCRSTTDDNAWCFVCSECGKSFPRSQLHLAHNHGEINYCPNCGAKVLRNTPKCSETTTKAVG